MQMKMGGMKATSCKYKLWLRPDRLESLTRWAADGCTMAEMASNMGVTEKTLYIWQARFPEIAGAIQSGRDMGTTEVVNTAFRLALGLAVEEKPMKVRDADGGERIEIVKSHIPPNATMLIFLLKNRAGYRDNPPDPPAKAAEGLPDDPLSKALDEVARGLEDGRHGA